MGIFGKRPSPAHCDEENECDQDTGLVVEQIITEESQTIEAELIVDESDVRGSIDSLEILLSRINSAPEEQDHAEATLASVYQAMRAMPDTTAGTSLGE